jgi:hypothetical protein
LARRCNLSLRIIRQNITRLRKSALILQNGRPATWDVVYKTDPPTSALPKYLLKGTTNMFGPEWLLSETPAGRQRDVPVQMVDD